MAVRLHGLIKIRPVEGNINIYHSKWNFVFRDYNCLLFYCSEYKMLLFYSSEYKMITKVAKPICFCLKPKHSIEGTMLKISEHKSKENHRVVELVHSNP